MFGLSQHAHRRRPHWISDYGDAGGPRSQATRYPYPCFGTCNPDFKASGGHTNVDNKQHGLLNPDGPDSGDLPNVYAGVDGIVRVELFATRVNVSTIMDEDGSAIVVHENRDDHTTQPIGGAGGALPAEC